MRKRIIAFLITFIVALSVPLCAFANTSEYTIDSYDVNIKVSEDNTYYIVEKIRADFNIEKHGIFRKIPFVSTVSREDGSSDKIVASVKDIKVDGYNYEVYDENGYRVIQIGDENTYLTGTHDYTISYTYSPAKDYAENVDEFYYNIIGTEWDTTISNATFSIEMPKDFDSSKIGFTRGLYGSSQTSEIPFTVEQNTIKGSFSGTLNKYEGMTTRIELEDGYFAEKDVQINAGLIASFLIPIICVLAIIILWAKHGKDDKVVKTVEFYPPDNLNSLEIARWYNGSVDRNDATSLLIYLASKGYLSIQEKAGKYNLIKIKDYDGNDENEKRFFNDIFKKGRLKKIYIEENGETKEANAVPLSKLQDTFYATIDVIVGQCNKRKRDIFVANGAFMALAIPLVLITECCILVLPFINFYGSLNADFFVSLLLGFAMAVGFSMLFTRGKKGQSIVGIIVLLISCGIGYLMLETMYKYQPFYLGILVFGIISIAIISFFFVYMEKRTPQGRDMLGRIRGFKDFLETAEKEKLEELVDENPEYFYNILPYAYVLGVSNKWSKKFESIAIEPPTWYYGYGNTFNVIMFNRTFNHTMNSISTSMVSQPAPTGSTGSSGGFSGGGFSGGGFGGGGGGSW